MQNTRDREQTVLSGECKDKPLLCFGDNSLALGMATADPFCRECTGRRLLPPRLPRRSSRAPLLPVPVQALPPHHPVAQDLGCPPCQPVLLALILTSSVAWAKSLPLSGPVSPLMKDGVRLDESKLASD